MKWFLRLIIITVLCDLLFEGILLAQRKISARDHIATTSFTSGGVKWFQQGFTMKLLMNNQLVLGGGGWDNTVPPEISNRRIIGLEYPVGSCNEHLFAAAPTIGGIIDGVRYVSEAYNSTSGTGYFIPAVKDSLRNNIWVDSRNDTAYDPNRFGFYKTLPNKRGYDDDLDGKIDEDELNGMDDDNDWNRVSDDLGTDGLPDDAETGCQGGFDPVTNPDPAFDNYEPSKQDRCRTDAHGQYFLKNDKNSYTQNNGIPDHGEPHVDEDYGVLSDQDVYISATDTVPVYSSVAHKPMGIKIVMKSYAWGNDLTEPILPIEYQYINIGQKTIRDVFLGVVCDADVGNVCRGTEPFWRNVVGYNDTLRTVYVDNPVDRGVTPIGLTILGTPRSFDSLRYIVQWHDFLPPCGSTGDSALYSCMSCEAFGYTNCFLPNPPQTQTMDTRFLLSFGPFDELKPGDTLRIAVAFVSGDVLDYGPNNLMENVERAIMFHRHGYRIPGKPPSPCLDISTDEKYLTLNWGRRSGCIDPRDVWDESNCYAGLSPDTSWRRRNPRDVGTPGGRIFEGYRVYRSEDPNGSPNTFSIVRQCDIEDDIFDYNVGIDTVFQDTTARRGNTYWYAVTAFSIPDFLIREYPVSGGGVKYDTIIAKSYESSILENAQKIHFPFGPSKKLGEVKVVPNPYRSDAEYTGHGGFEGSPTSWDPTKRMVRFIDLPSKATIRIYTIAGEVIHTIYHDELGGDTIGQEDYILLSESGRALAPGIYIFSVESELGTQIGKFVIIY